MIHRFQPIPPSCPDKPNWPLRLAISAALGLLAGLLCWCCGGVHPAAWFCGAACFTLSSCLHLDIEMKYAPDTRAGDYLSGKCNAWRLIRSGILLYREGKPGLCIFLPWASLQEARMADDGISLWNEETDTFFLLPIAGSEKETTLLLIQGQITEKRVDVEEKEAYEKAVFFMGAPFNIPVLPCALTALPWFILGAISPFLFPESAPICFVFLAFGSACATASHYDLEEDFLSTSYVGDEVRRTRSGIITRTDGGLTFYIPWDDMDDATITALDSVFLKMRGERVGLVLTNLDGQMPVRIARRYTRIHRWICNIGRLALVFASAIAGFLWHTLWN